MAAVWHRRHGTTCRRRRLCSREECLVTLARSLNALTCALGQHKREHTIPRVVRARRAARVGSCGGTLEIALEVKEHEARHRTARRDFAQPCERRAVDDSARGRRVGAILGRFELRE